MWCVSDMYAMIRVNSYYTKIVVMCATQILSRRMKMKVNYDNCVFRLEFGIRHSEVLMSKIKCPIQDGRSLARQNLFIQIM